MGAVNTSYLIMPHGKPSGCLEHALLEAPRYTGRIPCAEEYYRCVSLGQGDIDPNHEAKIKVHAYIAAHAPNPGMTLGQSAMASLWDFTQPSLKVMLEFIEMMANA
jgi:hypothetical protein